MENMAGRLRYVHGIAAFTHLASTVFILIVILDKKNRRNVRRMAPIVLRETAKTKGWRKEIDYAYILPVFPLLSCTNHVVSLLLPKNTTRMITAEVNHWRWIEYAASASVMLWVVAMLAGIQDLGTLLSIVLCNIGLQLVGYTMELKRAQKPVPRDISWIIGWLLHGAIWLPIMISFFAVVRSSSNPVPSAVWSIIIVLFVIFSTFGIVGTMWSWKRIHKFEHVEMAYAVLSLTSKCFLTYMAFFGVMRSSS